MDLYKGKNWNVIFVDWCQEFPGQCIISCQKESLYQLTNEDWIELGILEKELERIMKKLFNATMFNFACLMNNSYKDNVKPNVHFQFIPRYKNVETILNKKYKDKHFGYNMWKWALSKIKRQKDIFTQEERMKLFEIVKKEWNI